MSTKEELQKRFLAELYKHIPYDGWSSKALKAASLDLGYDEQFYKLLFEGDLKEVFLYYSKSLDAKMVAEFAGKTLKGHEKIIVALTARLKALAKQRACASKTISFMLNPLNLSIAMPALWHTMDTIWYDIVNDQSTDFNYYSKRGLLLKVYIQALLYIQSDDSKNHESTADFVERKILEVLEFGKFISKIKKHMNFL
jgi:ubiquinone biosynthesis protein COQ9